MENFKILAGTKLNNKYEIEEELGKGRFSRVYAAKDIENKKYAIKVYRGGKRYRKYFDNEIHIFKLIKEDDQESNNNNIVKCLDYFAYLNYDDSKNESTIHPCCVLNILGEDMHELLKKIDDGLPASTVSKITKQLLIGLKILHAKNIIHTDLSIFNILLTKPIKDIGTNDDISVVISDLGTSTVTDSYFQKFIGTLEYQAPEAVLELKYTTATDIWSLGCIVYELVTGERLFNIDDEESSEESETIDIDFKGLVWSDEELEDESSEEGSDPTWDTGYQHLKQMEELIGKMPRHITKLAKNYFNSRGNLIHNPEIANKSIEKKLLELSVEKKEAKVISKFLGKCIKYLPSERATADQLLNDKFIKK